MRNALVSIGACGLLGAILAACGGGGSGSSPTPAVNASPVSVASMNPNQSVTNVAGPTGNVTITFAIPRTAAASPDVRARIKAHYGSKLTDAHIRTMANTSPSATIRAAGAQQNRYAQAVEASTKRSALYVSSATEYAELVLSQGSTIVFDGTVSCPESSNTCTAPFTVPVGTNYTLSLYLYDYCNYLLSVGTVANVNVAAGTNSPVTVTLDGVASYFDTTSTASQPFVAQTAQSGFTLNIVAWDADEHPITTPGILLDESLKQITGFSVALGNSYTDVTPTAPQTLTLNPDLSIPAATYNYGGTGNESTVVWNITPIDTGSPIAGTNICGAQSSYNGYNCDGISFGGETTGQFTIDVTQPSLQWTQQSSGIQFSTVAIGASSSETAEFPAAVGSTYMFGLVESSSYTGNITLSDNGHCSGVVYSYTPGLATPAPYSTLSASPYVQITLAYPQPASSACIVTATDTNGRTANLTLLIDSSTLTIQNTARKH